MLRNAWIKTGLVLLVALPSLAQAGSWVNKMSESTRGEPDEERALVYFVRPAFMGFAVTMWGFVDDQVIGLTKGKSYIYDYVEPGEHVVWSKTGENVSPLNVNLEAGKTYYFKQKVRPGGFIAQVKIEEIGADEAEPLFKKMKEMELTEEGLQKGSEVALQWRVRAEEKADKRAERESE